MIRIKATRRRLALSGVLYAASVVVSALGSADAVPAAKETRPVVYSAEVDAIIHPVSAGYMIDTIDRADAAGARLVVFTLRTPGGLVTSTEAIVSRMMTAKTPVAVFVGPSGARAASAGFIITIAADLAVMAPGTHIGAASPVSGGGEKIDETMAKKATSDLAAYVRTIATRRHRNVALAEEAVTKARAFTEQEALEADPPLIDFVASDLRELLKTADGRTIARFDGTKATLKTADTTVVPFEMNWRQRVLSAIAHPNVAYLLLSLGTLGLTIELWNPGAILPGVIGGLCLLLAFFAFSVLPVNYAGVLLIFFGLLLLVLEVKVTSFGLLTVGGIVSLLLGSMMLMDTSAPELQVSLRLILPVTLGLASILIFLVRLAVAAQQRRSVTGAAGMLDEVGEALSAIEPGQTGRVSTHGEIWSATARDPIAPGDQVRVVGIDGLTLTVEKLDRSGRQPATGAPQTEQV